MKSTHEILKAAKALIADPRDWCQGRLGSGSVGNTAPFCSVGAVAKVTGILAGDNKRQDQGAMGRFRAAEKSLNNVAPSGSIVLFNDQSRQSHECVMAAFDAAIEKTAPK